MRGRALAFLAFSLAFAAAARGAGAQGREDDVTYPVVKRHVDAVYPASAVPSGQHADVELAVVVDSHGNVSKVEVVKSGGKELDLAATTAVRQWLFEPAKRGGVPIAARVRVPFHFAPLNQPVEVPRTKSDDPVVPGNVVAPGGARGVTGPAPASLGKPAEPPLESVLVPGRTAPPVRGAGETNARVGALADVPRRNATGLLELAPGFLLTNVGGDGHAEQVFLRGFDAREGQDIEFSVNGVPVNEAGNLHGNGYADLHFVIPEVVESLRVVEGPFDPRQGNFAVAGSANYELGLARRGLGLRTTFGSFGTQRALLTFGPKDASRATFGAVDLYKTDGYGQNRAARRGTVMAQYEGRLGDTGSYRLLFTGYANRYGIAGLLRADDVAAGRRDFYDTVDARQGGDSSRWSASADIEAKAEGTLLRQQVFFIQRGLRTQENFTGFLLDTQTPLQQPHRQRGDLLDLHVDTQTFGARGSARLRGKAFHLPQELEVGYFARGDRVDATQDRIEARTGFPYKRENDLLSLLGDVGLFADASVRPLRWLTFRGGVRGDLFTYDVLDRCAARDVRQPSSANPPGDASCLSQQDQGKYREPVQRRGTASTSVMPRGSVLFGPFEGILLSASYGRGVRSIDPVYVNEGLDTPFVDIQSVEGGATFARRAFDVDLSVKSVLFGTHVDKDLVFNQTAGRNTLASGTQRTGWIGSVRATGDFFDESASVTLVRSAFDDTGLLVPYVPDLVARSDSAVFADLPVKLDGTKLRGALSLGLTYVGHRALPFGQRSDVIFTADASANLGWRGYEVALSATNLANRQYRLGEFNFASDFHSGPQPTLVPARHFSAGAPRAVFLTLSATFGGS